MLTVSPPILATLRILSDVVSYAVKLPMKNCRYFSTYVIGYNVANIGEKVANIREKGDSVFELKNC